jgi:hypothetical protein
MTRASSRERVWSEALNQKSHFSEIAPCMVKISLEKNVFFDMLQ